MLLSELSNIKKYYGDRCVLEINDLKLYEGDRIGIVGLNGAGKTTLLDIIAGRIKPDEGTIKAYGGLSYITQLGDAEGTADRQLLKAFNVADMIGDHLSGGEKTRLKIAQVLSSCSSIILADEPTCNLDLNGIRLLEDALRSHKGMMLLVSHDRELLDNLCNSILEVENGTVRLYSGNYSRYKEQKDAELERQHFEYEQYVTAKRKLEEAIEEKKYKVRTMKKAPSRMGNSEARLHKMGNQKAKANLDRAQKALESRLRQLATKEKPTEQQCAAIDIQGGEELHSKVLICGQGLGKCFGSRVIFKDAAFEVQRGTKTALIGENGSGKTTLLRMITSGEAGITAAKGARIGYFSQNMDILDSEKSILENVLEGSAYPKAFARTVLARLLFKREEVDKKVGCLSGGERVRVCFAKIFLQDINLIVLDEPTNYLDIYSMEAVENAIMAYQGTVLFVSHDRRFVRKLADRILAIEAQGIVSYNGSYDEYQAWKQSAKQVMKKDGKEAKMLLENRLTHVLSRLSMPDKGDDVAALDLEYKKLLSEIRALGTTK